MAEHVETNTTSREAILANIQRASVPRRDLPHLSGEGIVFENSWGHFAEVLTSVGGQVIAVDDPGRLAEELRRLPAVADAESIVCRVPDVKLGNLELESVDDPKDLANVDVAVFPGLFAVAENAAVWVNDLGLRHRAIYFIAQHLVLVVHRSQCVDNMHQAYDRLSFAERSYGVFISGPSKTADIEQSLVIGAQGPRSLTVVIVGRR